jgi:hypothetical protein
VRVDEAEDRLDERHHCADKDRPDDARTRRIVRHEHYGGRRRARAGLQSARLRSCGSGRLGRATLSASTLIAVCAAAVIVRTARLSETALIPAREGMKRAINKRPVRGRARRLFDDRGRALARHACGTVRVRRRRCGSRRQRRERPWREPASDDFATESSGAVR